MQKIILILIVVFILSGSSSFAQIAVIINKSVPLDKIERSKLLDIYTGDVRTWDYGESIIIFDLKKKTDTKMIFYRYLGKTTSRMKSIWLKNMLSGEVEPPKTVTSEMEMLEKVEETKGAIGYISASKVTKNVKIICLIPNNKK